jgi:glycosyltransferase involved in cell wall biosynthesis
VKPVPKLHSRPGWWLRIAGENQAELEWDPDRPERVGVAIHAVTSGANYDLQLNQGSYEVSAGASYRLTFRGRAGANRDVRVGFSMATEPWSNLGLYRRVEFAPEWREYAEEFTANSDNYFGRIHFDLGDAGTSVEIDSVCLWRVTSSGLIPVDRIEVRPSPRNPPQEVGPAVDVGDAGGAWVIAAPNPANAKVLPTFRMFAVLGTWMEADIVGANVRNAMAQGCERVYLVDNGSTDGTMEAAMREGAMLARSFRTSHYDEEMRLRHMNDVVSEVSRAEGGQHIWWLYLDADEFPHGPWGMTLREYLANLDVRFRVVGTRFFNHYPSGAPQYVPGRHPLDFQPLCEELAFPMCPRGHRKHPILRFDRNGALIECGAGFHSATCAEQLYEPVQPAFLHHFPFREKNLTRQRLEVLWAKNSEGVTRALESNYTTHMLTRFRSLDAVYAQDWARVENFIALDPLNTLLKAPVAGVQPKPWVEIVETEHQPVFRWYALPMTGAWKYESTEKFRYGDDTTYRKGIAFLDGHGLIEDWGCGFAHARSFVSRSEYVGIDGSSPQADKIAELRKYESQAECIFMRHVLEHNTDWSRILANAVASFRRRMTLVIFTPFGETTRVIATSATVTAFPMPDISFRKEDLTAHFHWLKYFEESLTTDTQYGVEHVFYIEKSLEPDEGEGKCIDRQLFPKACEPSPSEYQGQRETRAEGADGSTHVGVDPEPTVAACGTAVVPKLTVVLTTYNHERFIGQAIDSILAQETRFPFNLVIIEDCSTDRTREIVIQYQLAHPERIRLVLSDVNRCDNVAFMREVEQAAGEYVALLDGDDYWTSPHKLQKQVEYLDRHLECAISSHNALMVYDDGSRDPRNTNPPNQKETSTLEDLFEGRLVHTATVVVRKASVGRFPAVYGQEKNGDWAMFLLAARKGTIGYIDEIMAVYRLHAGGFWTGISAAEQQRRIVQFYENARDYVPPEYRGAIAVWLARSCCDVGAECEIAGDQQGAHEWFSKAVIAEPDIRKTQWRLRTAGGCAAEVSFPQNRRDAVHVAVDRIAGASYDLQLNLRRFRVRRDGLYRIRFQARADQPRRIRVGFAEAQEPWKGLGFFRDVELEVEWQDFEDWFVSTGDHDNARVHFDLGDSVAGVEVAGVTVTDSSSGENVSLYRTAEELAEEAGPQPRNRDSVDESVWEALKDAKRTDRSTDGRIRSGECTLRTEGGAMGEMVAMAGAGGPVRVSIQRAPPISYDLQLNYPYLSVTGNERYAVEFRARADAPRTIAVGFAEAHQPWQNLGWSQIVELAGEWREFREDFVATRNESNGRIHFDLGGSGESVEIAGVRLLHLRGAP